MRKIVYTQRVEIVESYGERRDCADQQIAAFISACGFLPIPVPNYPLRISEIVQELKPSGIVLTGGNDLIVYGGNAPERDETEEILIRLAIEKEIPLYGFCRGMQMILHRYGAKLVQTEGHVAVRHPVKGTIGERTVNSFHRWAYFSAEDPKLEILAQTDDGVIEAVRVKDRRILGTMWHPERCDPFDQEDIKMVKELFGATDVI